LIVDVKETAEHRAFINQGAMAVFEAIDEEAFE